MLVSYTFTEKVGNILQVSTLGFRDRASEYFGDEFLMLCYFSFQINYKK